MRHVAHVQRDDHRPADPLQLEHQPQVQAQVGGVDDADQQVRRRLAGMPAQHDVARDRFVEARGFEAVGAGQVEQAVGRGRSGADEAALLALDGDARVVRDFLAAAGEAIEEGGLAAVGHADEREAGPIAVGAAAPGGGRGPREAFTGVPGTGNLHPD